MNVQTNKAYLPLVCDVVKAMQFVRQTGLSPQNMNKLSEELEAHESIILIERCSSSSIVGDSMTESSTLQAVERYCYIHQRGGKREYCATNC